MQNKVVSLGNQYNSRYFDANGQALPVTWRADSAQWLESVTPQWQANAKEAASLAEELRGYKDYLDEDTYNAAMDAINVSAESNRTIFSRAKNENGAFSPFTSEKDYTLVSAWAGQDEAESQNTWNNLQKNLAYAYSQEDAELIDEAVYAANLYADYYAGSGKKDSSVYYMTQEYQQNRRLQRLDEINAEIENLEKESAAYSADTQKWLTNPQEANGVNPQNMSGQWDRNARIEQLKQERAQLEASANYYESHDQAYNRAMAVTGNADFGEIAMIQDLPQNQNPTREEMDAYDQSTAYAEVPEGTYVPAGQESQYSRQSTTAAAPEIKDPLGLYLNATEAERAEAQDINSTTGGTWARAVSKGVDGRWDLMREDDVAAYYYILNTKGTKDAEKFLEDISTRLLQRENEAFTEDLENASTGELVAAAALSVFTKPFTSIISGGSLIASGAKWEYFNPNLNPVAQGTDAVREELSKRANVHKDNFVGNVLHAITGMEYGELLQTGFSFADSETTRALFGPASSVVLGMDAARSAATKTYENGGSKGQIFATAFMAGLAETVFEYVSLEHFADKVLDGNYYRATELFKQAAIQGGVEASEEVFTEIANTISNGIIMGKMSDYNIAVQSYISEGYSEADAKKKATTDVLANIWSSAAGGFLSGGARTAAVGPVILAKNQAAYGKKIAQSSEAIAKDKHSIDTLITVAENAKEMGNKLEQAKIDKQIAAVKADPSVANIKALENTTNKITRDYMIKTGNEALKMAETEKDKQDAQLTADIAKTNPDFAGFLVMANQEAMKNKGTYSVGTGTTNKNTGEDIKITGVHRTREKGKPSLVFQLEDGSTINASDVSYDSNNKAVVAETLADTGIRADYAMSLYDSVTDSMEGAYVAAGIQDAIDAGMLGESFEVVKKGRFASDLTAAQLKTAYDAGKALGSDYYNKRKGLASQKTSRNLAVENENGKVVGTFYDGTEGANLRETTKAQLEQLKMIAKAINANVEIYASSVVNGVRQFTDRRGVVHKGNAAYIPGTNTIVIDINAGDTLNGLVLNSMSHEVVHYIAEMAPDKFRKLADFVVGKFGEKGQSVTDLVRNKQSKYAAQGEKLTFMEAFEEVVADSVESMLSQKADKIAADIAEMRKVDADLAKTFVDKVKEIAKRILTVFKKNNFQSNPETVEGKFFAKWTEVQDELASLFAEGAAAAADTVARQAETATAKDMTKEGVESIVDSDGEPLNQLRTMKQDLDYYMQDLKDAGLVGPGKAMTESDLKYLYDSINKVMDYVDKHIEEIERSEDFREMDGENRPFLPYKDNSDPHYKMALDYSTLCRKRLLTQAITERLQRALKRALSPVEQVRIRNEIQELQKQGKKLEVACALCYVEAARLKSPKVINEFLSNKEASMKNYFSLKNKRFKNEVYLERIAEWKEQHGLSRDATKADVKNAGIKVSALNKFALSVRDGYWAWAEKNDKETYLREKAIIDKAMSMDNEEFLNATSLARLSKSEYSDIYDAFIFKVRSATRSKAQETDVPYKRGDIDMVGDAIIEQMNEESGFRHQSWSDFQAMHLLDTVAAIIELSTKKAKVHTYTKVADMVRFLGETNMAINMSLIPSGDTGLDANGELVFDPIEGMAFEIMNDLRNKYHATAGNIAIGISDEQIKALLASPLIDYVIPYHTSGLNADMRRRMGIKAWKNYQSVQNEKGDGQKPTLAEWFDPKAAASASDGIAYMVKASEKYLALCHERGLTPKFSAFLHQNKDGSYSLADDAQNYWKMLIDRKMVDQVTNKVIIQKPVVPRFNVDTMLDILSEEVNSEAAKDAREAEDYIVNKMLTDKSPFTKEEIARAKILNDAAIRMAIENTSADAEVKNSIRSTVDGLKYVKLDGNIFLRSDGTEMTKREAYNALVGKTITLEDGDKITFIKKLPGGLSVYNELFNKRPGYDPSIDVIAISDKINRNIIETLKASTMKTPNEVQRHPHIGVVDFDLREVYLADDNKTYRLELNIANLTDGSKIAYVKRYIENADVEVDKKIRMAETARKSPLNRPSDEASQDASVGIISNPSEKSNPQFEKNSNSLRNVTERQTIMEMLDSLPYEVEHNQYFQEYRNKVKDIDRKQAILDDLNEEWRELMFKKGKRSEETKARLAEIRTEANRLNQQIAKLDSRLLELSEFRPFRNLVKAAEKKQKAIDKQKMTEYRANVKLKEEKQKILRTLKDINSFLIANTKDHHVPAELRKQFAEALMAFDFGYSNSQKAKTYLLEIADAYKKIANSNNPMVASWYDQGIEDAFEHATTVVGETNLYDMNEEQTKALYDLLKRMRHRIAKSNRLISDNMKEKATEAAYNASEEIKAANNKERRVSDSDLVKYIEKRSFDDLKPIYFFSRIGSQTLQKMFQNIINGQYVYAKTMREAGKWIAELNEKYGANEWDRNQRFTFKDVAGESFQLTLGEIMDIYAHSRREQSKKHLLAHGIVTVESRIKTKEKNGRVKQEKYADSANHPLSADVLAEILSDENITKDQKEYVAALQDYLSDVMGQKGNEVSLAMDGVALYGEKHYWPIKTVSWYNAIDPQQKGVPSIASPNHSKAVTKYAASPIVVRDALETWNKHVQDMSMYYGMAIPVSDFMRVVNVKTLENTTNVGGVRQTLDQYCGPAASQYISDLLNDLNGGITYGSGDDLADKMITLAKKSAVMLSLSVAIQQPSAIVRATMYIPPKYFLKKKEYNDLTVKGFYDRWEHLCDIAPIAQLKDMGGFDTGTGMSGQDYLRRQSETKLTDIIDDVTGFLPATMDKLTWLKIYDAAEAMVRDNNKGLSESEIQTKAVELFSNVIELTQVYDSVLTRPGTMRKKDSLAKMITSFAAEPMVSINMVNDAITKVIRNEPGARKNLAKALGVVVAAALVNALLKSLVTAWRDDDEDEMLYEKYLSAVLGNFLSDALVYTNLPIVRDVVSMLEGYSTDRMDMTVISDIINAWGKVINNGTDWNEVLDAIFTTTSLTPIPLKNVWKDIKGGINFVKGLGRDIRGENTPTWTGFTQAVRDGIPILTEDNNSEALYKAYLSGNSKDVQQFRANFKTETAADSAVKSELRKRDKRVLEAAILRYNGNVNGSAALVTKIAKDTNIPEDLVHEAVMAEMEKYRKKQNGNTEEEYNGEVSPTTSTSASQYTLTDLKLALEQGRPTEDIIDKIIADKVAGGVTKKQATSQVKTSVLSTYKPLYYDAYVKGDKAEMERIKKLLVGTDLWNATELNNIFKNYIKNKEDE